MGQISGHDRLGQLTLEKEKEFPNLRKEGYCVAENEDANYNCIAFAAGVTNTRWWPPIDGVQVEGVDWPTGVPPEETVEAFILAFGTKDFVPCDGPEPEDGFEKIAIYVNEADVPQHAARLIDPCASWASKLGSWEGIRHKTLSAVECRDYGKAKYFLKRPTRFPVPASIKQVMDCLLVANQQE